MLVAEKVFENRKVVLRPFRARNAESESKAVGKALGLQSHSLAIQRSLLRKEFLFAINSALPSLPFTICRVSDALDLFLVLSGNKPASMISYKSRLPGAPASFSFKIGGYALIHAGVYGCANGPRELIISRDRELIRHILTILSECGGGEEISAENFRAAGIAFGYPQSAVENFVSLAGRAEQMERYVHLLLENDSLITSALWNSTYIPALCGGEAFEIRHLERWNSILAKEIGEFLFEIASAYNKISKLEILIAHMDGKTSWEENPCERLLREAIERAYGIPLSVSY